MLKPKENGDWLEIQRKIREWFAITLLPPTYEKGISINIESKYEKEKGKEFDIISGGSGFHQSLTLLAFFYGYEGVSTILFDEPDAHMHVNLQREILNYFQQLKTTQFIIATHAEEFINGVSTDKIISVLKNKPERINSTPDIITALSDVDNMAIVCTIDSPYILYVEGEDDERILNGWASVLDKQYVLEKFYVEKMGGATKELMLKNADKHFGGLKKIVTSVKRIILFDYDSEQDFHPGPGNPSLFEWRRKNIENYLLVPDAWKNAVLDRLNEENRNDGPMFNQPIFQLIDDFFDEQNLSLAKGKTWRNVSENIFTEVNGKKILFENNDSLFQRINKNCNLKINRQTIRNNFSPQDLHQDIVDFFDKLEKTINKSAV